MWYCKYRVGEFRSFRRYLRLWIGPQLRVLVPKGRSKGSNVVLRKLQQIKHDGIFILIRVLRGESKHILFVAFSILGLVGARGRVKFAHHVESVIRHTGQGNTLAVYNTVQTLNST